ncbi:MAG: methyltransferase [Kofleriaceae bacterium]
MKRKKDKAPPRSLDDLLVLAKEQALRGELAEAEARYREALDISPGHLAVITLLALVMVDRDNTSEAIDLLEEARDFAPDFAPIQLALGSAYAMAGHDEIAVATMEIASKLDSEGTVAFERLAKHHVRCGRPREAIGVLRRLLRREPSNADAQFMLTALTGEQPVVREHRPALVAELFDSYASTFDAHLAKLEYDAPRELAALVASVQPPPSRGWLVVDLGCGTGHVGSVFRDWARSLVGSDLSPRMIVRARERAVYDELHVEDLRATLERVRDVDLIVAADVFNYVGTLDATLAACATALRPGGLLAFSTELGETDDIALQTTFRYRHSDSYVRGVAEASGLAIERLEPTILRKENDQPARGSLYVLRR